MINIPKQYITPIITTPSPQNTVRFHSIADEERAVKAMERRLSPTRRQPQLSKIQIEQLKAQIALILANMNGRNANLANAETIERAI